MRGTGPSCCTIPWAAGVLLCAVHIGFAVPAPHVHHGQQIMRQAANDNGIGRPIADWYFQVALERGWFGWHQYYCKLATKTSKVDSTVTADIVDCSDTNVPYTSPFALLTKEGDQVPAMTGQPLFLLSFTHGLCSSQPSSPSGRHQHSDYGSGGPAKSLLHDSTSSLSNPEVQAGSRKAQEAEGVQCSTEGIGSSTFSLLAPDSEPGQAIPFSTPVYLLEEGRYCTVGSTEFSDRALVCNLGTADGAVRLLFHTSAYPYASFSSLFTGASCGVKSLLEPPSHDILCAQEEAASPQLVDAYVPSLKSSQTLLEDREPRVTLIMQTPGQPLVSGSTVSISVFYPGLAGRLLQICCATKDPPHIVYCEAAADTIAAECWFQLNKVDEGVALGQQVPLEDGSMVSLTAYAVGRFCSTAFDGTLLCASASFSKAARNLFLLSLSHPIQSTLPGTN